MVLIPMIGTINTEDTARIQPTIFAIIGNVYTDLSYKVMFSGPTSIMNNIIIT